MWLCFFHARLWMFTQAWNSKDTVPFLRFYLLISSVADEKSSGSLIIFLLGFFYSLKKLVRFSLYFCSWVFCWIMPKVSIFLLLIGAPLKLSFAPPRGGPSPCLDQSHLVPLTYSLILNYFSFPSFSDSRNEKPCRQPSHARNQNCPPSNKSFFGDSRTPQIKQTAAWDCFVSLPHPPLISAFSYMILELLSVWERFLRWSLDLLSSQYSHTKINFSWFTVTQTLPFVKWIFKVAGGWNWFVEIPRVKTLAKDSSN